MFINKKAFTLVEMIMVIVIIGILMMGTTIYLQGSDDTRKIIETQGCATNIGGLMNNYVFYSLTSKDLRDGSNVISPDFYYVSLSGCNIGEICNKFIFSYSGGGHGFTTYKTYDIKDTCNTSLNLRAYRTGGIGTNSIITMNKGFAPINLSNPNTFYIKSGDNIITLGEIILAYCTNKHCDTYKDVSKRVVDGRTQTIYQKNCAFYDENNKNRCKTREGCKVYSGDSIECLEY